MYSEPWLTCSEKNKLFLLAKDDNAYYLIAADKKLDIAAEETLKNKGVTERILRDLGLNFERIPKSALRGIALGGYGAGSLVYLYQKSGKRKLMLQDDYSREWMDQFFFGLQWFTPPADENNTPAQKSWRKQSQDPEMFKQLKFVPILLGAASLICGIGYRFAGGAAWFVGCVICVLVPVVLDILFPAYFTLLNFKDKAEKDAWELNIPVFFVIVFLITMPMRNWLNESDFWKVIGISAVSFSLLMCLVEEFRREKWAFFAALLLGAFLGQVLVGHGNEVFAHTPPETYTLTVEELRTSRRREKCTVTMPDGQRVELGISGELYRTLEVGDLVLVECGVGAFGIEYANVICEQ